MGEVVSPEELQESHGILERLEPPAGEYEPWTASDEDPCRIEERLVVNGRVIWNPTWCAPGRWIDKGDPSPLK